MQQEPFNVGDTVRRKNDKSGRTRVVTQISSDGEFVTLDAPFDRWSVWHVSQLVKVNSVGGETVFHTNREIPVRKVS